MGMATSKVRLNICGSSYVVNTSESEDYMQNLADRLNLDMNELMASSNSVSITTAAVMTALNYRDELEKASGSADNMRRQIKDYLEDAASAKMAAEETRTVFPQQEHRAASARPGVFGLADLQVFQFRNGNFTHEKFSSADTF